MAKEDPLLATRDVVLDQTAEPAVSFGDTNVLL